MLLNNFLSTKHFIKSLFTKYNHQGLVIKA